jgi:hypothetical protein
MMEEQMKINPRFQPVSTEFEVLATRNTRASLNGCYYGKDLDYILYCKGTERMLIPLSQVCQNVVLRPERAASNNGDESPSSQGAVAYPPTPLK